MEWSKKYKSNEIPSIEEISKYINNNLWEDLCEFIEQEFNVKPKIEYSTCSLKPGWNVKYKKSGKSICTLYPDKDNFTCMVTVGNKNQTEIEYMLPSCDKYIQEIYKNTTLYNGNRWLMIDSISKQVIEDVKEIISIKMKH